MKNVSTARRWTRAQLQHELRRREMFPPSTFEWGWTVPQEVTSCALDAELALIPTTHPRREWLEWEWALAVEHERMWPGKPFIRYIDREEVAS
jgi:hypothetical protein